MSTPGSLNLAVLEEGQVYELVLTDIPVIGMRETKQKRISEVVRGVDTELTVCTRLMNQFNAKVDYAVMTLDVTGTTVNDILITGSIAGYNFNVTPTADLGYAETEVNTAVGFGSGTNAQISKVEFDGLAEDGMNNTYSASERNVWKETSNVITGAHYAMHVIKWADQREGEVSNKDTYTQTLKVCLPQVTTGVTTVTPETGFKIITDIIFA